MTRLDAAGVLLDMDGTLIDSTATVERVWGEFARQTGLDPQAVLAVVHGVPARATLRRFLGPDADIEPWFAQIHAWETDWFDADVAIPGAVEAVASLPRGRGALVTSAVRAGALGRMARLGFAELDVVIAAEDVHHGKPDPEPYLRGAAALGVEPGECVVLEDSDAGVRAGLAAGCTVVVVGALESTVTEGLLRVPDLRTVRFGPGEAGVTVAL